MKTIEELCKYKDVADLVYRHVHGLLTKALNNEYETKANQVFKYEGDCNNYPAFYGCGDIKRQIKYPCFNWRTLSMQAQQEWIYHVSFKNNTMTKTDHRFN